MAKVLADAVGKFLEDHTLPAVQIADNTLHRTGGDADYLCRFLSVLYKFAYFRTVYRGGDTFAVFELLQAVFVILFSAVRQRI